MPRSFHSADPTTSLPCHRRRAPLVSTPILWNVVPQSETAGPLAGLRVLDISTVLAGPLAAQILGDFGAEVIKVEHPQRPDALRGHGQSKDGVNLWWKVVGRNKRCITLYLGAPEGAEIFRPLVETSDVIVENFRPGTLEHWGLGPDALREINPKLIVARVTGWGQDGPYARRPGFGTLAEAMSGFAAATGEPGGAPTLPPFGLADSIAGITTYGAVVTALYERDRPGGSGIGQDVDLSILEPIAATLGPLVTWYDQLGFIQPRTGNRSTNNAPRNTYRTADDMWVAVSSSATPIAQRLLVLVGHPEVVDEPWFQSGSGRAAHVDDLDAWVAAWVVERTQAEVIDAFEQAEVAVAPVYDAAGLLADPHFAERGTFPTIDDDELGPMRMQGPLFRLTRTPGEIRHTGRPVGSATDEVLAELGLQGDAVATLRAHGIVGQ